MDYCLHVDDDPDDLEIFKEVFFQMQTKKEYKCFDSALDGLAFLKGTNSLPCLILIDLNMPRMGGMEFMKAIKDVPSLSHIPLIALTTSLSPLDREFCLRYCDGYFTKPLSYAEYPNLIKNILPFCEMESSKPQN